jgi:hypothetical protein
VAIWRRFPNAYVALAGISAVATMGYYRFAIGCHTPLQIGAGAAVGALYAYLANV